MKYLITGTTSGIGKAIKEKLQGDIHEINRNNVDLDQPARVKELDVPFIECAILNAGHDIGGGVPFSDHNTDDILKIINCNLVANVLLAQKLLRRIKDV